MAKFNIKEITAKAFSIANSEFVFEADEKNNKLKIRKPEYSFETKNKSGKRKIDLDNIDESVALGGKYFLTLSLKHRQLGANPVKLPNEPLVSLSLNKTIVETATVGKYRKGTVKEYICTEDYAISIRGVCIDPEDPNSYPAKQVRDLKNLIEVNDALEIDNSRFFNLFGITKIVLKDLKFEEMLGEAGMQKYTITAVSDQDFFADLTEKNEQLTNLKTT
jgi:hypothetical protein